MVETLPAFVAVIVAATWLVGDAQGALIGTLAQVFFFARVAHAAVYTLGVPYLRTPVYLISWGAILAIGYTVLT
jgi:uncharacterized MAPEG superfamily protein